MDIKNITGRFLRVSGTAQRGERFHAPTGKTWIVSNIHGMTIEYSAYNPGTGVARVYLTPGDKVILSDSAGRLGFENVSPGYSTTYTMDVYELDFPTIAYANGNNPNFGTTPKLCLYASANSNGSIYHTNTGIKLLGGNDIDTTGIITKAFPITGAWTVAGEAFLLVADINIPISIYQQTANNTYITIGTVPSNKVWKTLCIDSHNISGWVTVFTQDELPMFSNATYSQIESIGSNYYSMPIQTWFPGQTLYFGGKVRPGYAGPSGILIVGEFDAQTI